MPNAIRLQQVSKRFRLHTHASRSLKQALVQWARRYSRRGQRHEPEPRSFAALSDVTLSIEVGEAVAIIGQNGSGKSTLFKIISGILRPTFGVVEVHGRISPLIELSAGFHPELSGIENIFLNGAIYGMTAREIESKLDAIRAFADIGNFVFSPVRVYSSGMMARLAFAVAINVDADILLVDEVLAVGDIGFQRRCIERIQELKRSGATIVYVSHDLDSVARIADRVIWLEHGVVRRDGPPGPIVADYLRSQGVPAPSA